MKSGMLAAETIFPELTIAADKTVAALGSCDAIDEKPIEVPRYESELMNSWVAKELKEVRNTHAAFHYGLWAGMVYTAASCFITKGAEPWSFKVSQKDCSRTKPANECTPIEYPKPDGKLSFDLLTNLQRSGTSHDHDQPAHLRVKEHLKDVPTCKLFIPCTLQYDHLNN